MTAEKFSKLAWIETVICAPLPEAQRLAILCIGLTADRNGYDAWRANDRVVSMIGVSLKTVKRARAAAVAHGLMAVTKPAPRGAGNTRTTEYRLTMPQTNGVSRDPISSPEMGSPESANGVSGDHKWGQRSPEIGSPVTPPLGFSLGSSLGGALGEMRTGSLPPLDVEAVPLSDNASPPLISQSLEDRHPVEAELVDDDDPEPPLTCITHRGWPEEDIPACGGCARVRRTNGPAHHEWEIRQLKRAVQTPKTPKPPKCDWCDENGLLLGPDGLDADVVSRTKCDHKTPPPRIHESRQAG